VAYPDIPDLFFGEEVLVACELWTRGWDFFCPGGAEEIVFHQWTRSSAWKPREDGGREGALQRWRAAMASESLAPRACRTLAQFEEMCGVRFRDREVSALARRGGRAQESEFALAVPPKIDAFRDLIGGFLG
jgi:hypothetical protein